MKNKIILDICKRFSAGDAIKAKEIKSVGKYPVFGANGIRGYTDTFNFDGQCAVIGRQGAESGNVHYYEGKAYMTEHAIVAEANDENCSGYLAYKLMQMNLARYQGQSAQPGISAKTISKLPINVPDLEYQKLVFEALNSLEKKIANNNAITKQLEAMAKTIYDYWFLQFEFPNEEGKPYKSSGGKMAWNKELQREIPEKWEVSNLYKNNLTELIKPGVEEFVGTKKYLATADVNGTSYSKGTNVTFTNRESRANMQPTLNSVWFAKMKNSVKHLYLNKELTSIITETILSTGFCGLQCDEYSFEYLVSFIESDYFEKVKNQLAHGATQQAVNNSDLKNIKMVIPSKRILNKFHELTKDIFNLISEKKVENSELASLRNLLLPLLMNGQVTIGE